MRDYISDSFKGMERSQNKDRVLFLEQGENQLAIVFDGISSAQDANAGIDIAVDFLKEEFTKFVTDSQYSLADLMFNANTKILDSNLQSPFTTYCAIHFFDNDKAEISSLGDSRIYEVTPQYMKQITQDDNLVNNKNVVTKYLGMLDLDRSDVRNFFIEIQEKNFLLCSDGFYSNLENNLQRFYEVLNFKTAGNIKNALAGEIIGNNIDDASYIFVF